MNLSGGTDKGRTLRLRDYYQHQGRKIKTSPMMVSQHVWEMNQSWWISFRNSRARMRTVRKAYRVVVVGERKIA